MAATNVYFSISTICGFVLSVIASVGGGAVIVAAVVKFASDKIADRLQSKYQLKLDKEMEVYKAEIDKKLEEHKINLNTKQHISVKRFDAEFEIYQNLTKCFFDAVRDCEIMIPYGLNYVPADEHVRKKQDEDHYNKASNSVVEAQNYLYSIAPFIPEDFYRGYRDILSMMSSQLNSYERRFDVFNRSEDKNSFEQEDYNRTREINIKYEEVNGKVREYLSNLDVIG